MAGDVVGRDWEKRGERRPDSCAPMESEWRRPLVGQVSPLLGENLASSVRTEISVTPVLGEREVGKKES